MPPKKRGTRASKRKAEPEEEVEAGSEEVEGDQEEEQQEEEGGEPEEENMETEEAAPQQETDDGSEPPEKKAKSGDEQDEEKDKLEALEQQMQDEAERKKKEEEDKEAAKKQAEEAEKKRKEEEEKKRKEKMDEDLKKELDKYWKTVKDDPTDFTGWTYLLQFVDKKNIIEAAREAFNTFLAKYPYCYGYWKKYADFENRNGNTETVKEVFDKGLEAIPLSVDLWIHYLNYLRQSPEYKDDLDYIREQYNRAVQACGRDWKSDKIWEHFVKFETDNKNLIEIYQLYGRILKNATQGLNQQFDKFREFIKSTHPKELMETSEFLALRKEVLASLKGEKAGSEAAEGGEAAAPGGTDLVPGEEGAEEETNEETNAMKEKLIFSMKKIFKETQEASNWRQKYEDKLKRSYFHVKPLERVQLTSWNDYLTEMKKKNKLGDIDASEVEILYERCLIACALYEEFWVNYLTWLSSLETPDKDEKVRGVYKRACMSHLPQKVDIHLKWAAFEETEGKAEAAANVLTNLEAKHPDLLSIKLKRINFERRRGNDDMACELYSSCVKSVEAMEDLTLLADISIKYSRFLRLHMQNSERAKEVIQSALEKAPKIVKLYLQMLDILLHTLPLNLDEIVKFLDTTIAKEDFKPSVRLVFSQRKVEILEDFGTNVADLQAAHVSHEELSKSLKPAAQAEQAESNNSNQGGGGETISTLNSNRDGHKGGYKNGPGGGGNYPPVSNTPSYNASHAAAHANYGYRYSNYPSNYQHQPPYGGGPGYGY